jgi:hypothetical protein
MLFSIYLFCLLSLTCLASVFLIVCSIFCFVLSVSCLALVLSLLLYGIADECVDMVRTVLTYLENIKGVGIKKAVRLSHTYKSRGAWRGARLSTCRPAIERRERYCTTYDDDAPRLILPGFLLVSPAPRRQHICRPPQPSAQTASAPAGQYGKHQESKEWELPEMHTLCRCTLCDRHTRVS